MYKNQPQQKALTTITIKPVTYKTDAGIEVTLSPDIIRSYLVNGDGEVSDQEVMLFLELCRAQGLNPFLREAYLIKYAGTNPATIVTGKETFTKRAEKHAHYRGTKAGIVLNNKGTLEYREGSLLLQGENIVGGWADVYRDDRDVPARMVVGMQEYVGLKKDGTPNSTWTKRPATMIRKVALVAALREAFPDAFSGLYSEEEMSHVQSEELPRKPIDLPSYIQPIDQPETVQETQNANVQDMKKDSRKVVDNTRKGIVRKVCDDYYLGNESYAAVRGIMEARYSIKCDVNYSNLTDDEFEEFITRFEDSAKDYAQQLLTPRLDNAVMAAINDTDDFVPVDGTDDLPF